MTFDPNTTTSDYASLIVTHSCNRRCAFCVDKYRGSGEFISLDTVRRCVRTLPDTVKDVLIVGGEPTLHPEIVDIASEVRGCDKRVILTTNYDVPSVVKQLDGIVNCFNISFYNQKTLPHYAAFESDLTLHALIHAKQLQSRERLDSFIDEHKRNFDALKFSTLSPCNDWARKHQIVDYVDELPGERMVLFDEIAGQKYRGAIIKRYDRILNSRARQSIKIHVDGEMSDSWERSTP